MFCILLLLIIGFVFLFENLSTKFNNLPKLLLFADWINLKVSQVKKLYKTTFRVSKTSLTTTTIKQFLRSHPPQNFKRCENWQTTGVSTSLSMISTPSGPMLVDSQAVHQPLSSSRSDTFFEFIPSLLFPNMCKK